MSAREGWELCVFCNEPLGEEGDSGRIANGPSHDDCALRAMIGGLNHLMGRCTCCGGTEPPDPPGMSAREAARAAVVYWRLREARLRDVARETCHSMGIPWYDPTGKRHDPPT